MAKLSRTSFRSSRPPRRTRSNSSRSMQRQGSNFQRQKNASGVSRQKQPESQRQLPPNPLGLSGQNAVEAGSNKPQDQPSIDRRNPTSLENQSPIASGNRTNAGDSGSRDFLWPGEVESEAPQKVNNSNESNQTEIGAADKEHSESSGKGHDADSMAVGAEKEFSEIYFGDGHDDVVEPEKTDHSKKDSEVEGSVGAELGKKGSGSSEENPQRSGESDKEFTEIYFGDGHDNDVVEAEKNDSTKKGNVVGDGADIESEGGNGDADQGGVEESIDSDKEFTEIYFGDGFDDKPISNKPSGDDAGEDSTDEVVEEKPEKVKVEPPKTPEAIDGSDRVFFGDREKNKSDSSQDRAKNTTIDTESKPQIPSEEKPDETIPIEDVDASVEDVEGDHSVEEEGNVKGNGPEAPESPGDEGFKSIGGNRYQWQSSEFGTFTATINVERGAKLTPESKEIILDSLKNATLNYHEKHGLTYEGNSQSRDQSFKVNIKNDSARVNQGLFHFNTKTLDVNTDGGKIDASAKNVLEHEYTHFLQSVDYQERPGTNFLEAQAVGNEADGGLDWVQQRVLGHALQTGKTNYPQHVTIEELQKTRTAGARGRHNEQYNAVYGHGTLFLKFLGEQHPSEYNKLEQAHERGEWDAFTNTDFSHLESNWQGWFRNWANKNITEPNVQLDPDSHGGERSRRVERFDSEGYETHEFALLNQFGNGGDLDNDGRLTRFDYLLAARERFSA